MKESLSKGQAYQFCSRWYAQQPSVCGSCGKQQGRAIMKVTLMRMDIIM